MAYSRSGGIVPRRQPWVHNRFVRKGRGINRAVVLAIPASLALWGVILVAIGR